MLCSYTGLLHYSILTSIERDNKMKFVIFGISGGLVLDL
jgi:hypothetical protein